MRKLTAVAASAIVALSVSTPCRAADRSLDGEWVGGYTLNQEFVYITAHFGDSAGTPQGTVDILYQHLNGLTLSKVLADSSGVRFELALPTGALSFEGHVGQGDISGTVETAGEKGTFHLIRTTKVDTRVLHEDIGTYQLGPDRYVNIQPWMEVGPGNLVYEEAGQIRALFPKSDTTFFAGPAFMRPSPVEVTVRFVHDQHGKVTRLLWQRTDSPAISAARVMLRKEEAVTFHNGDVALKGVLLIPLTKGPHPAIVLIHGSGAEDRYDAMPFVSNLVRSGIAILAYDKRGVGESTGDWHTATFEDLARDALAGVELLKTRRDINPSQIGVWGISQGGWLGPLAASLSKDVAFVISVSGPGVTPAQESLDYLEHDMRAEGKPEAEIAQLVKLVKLEYGYIRTGDGWDYMLAFADSAKLGPLPPKDDGYWSFMRPILDYDPQPVLEKVQCPVLAMFGALDQNVLGEENKEKWEEPLRKGGNKDYTLIVFPGANHELLAAQTGSTNEYASLKGIIPEYMETMRKWLLKRVTIPNRSMAPSRSGSGPEKTE